MNFAVYSKESCPYCEKIKTVSLIERSGSSWAVDYTPKVLDTKQWVVFPWEL